jgi:hypothetical protein
MQGWVFASLLGSVTLSVWMSAIRVYLLSENLDCGADRSDVIGQLPTEYGN